MIPFDPTISSATGSTGDPLPLSSSHITPTSPSKVMPITVTSDHLVLHRL